MRARRAAVTVVAIGLVSGAAVASTLSAGKTINDVLSAQAVDGCALRAEGIVDAWLGETRHVPRPVHRN
jgi:hypothetical protein